jgi:integrase
VDQEDELIRDYIYLSLFTGARKSNVLAMAWPQIDLIAQTWTIPAESAKEGKAITVPLLPETMTILERRWKTRTNQWVLPSRNGNHLQQPEASWKRMLAKAGISGLHIHDLRRSLGSWMAATGASLPIIGKSLGHTPGSPATAVYARLSDSPVREAMQKGVAALLAAGKDV